MTGLVGLPAILGGEPVRPQGAPDWPLANAVVQEALAAAYQSGAWGKYHGGQVEELEKELAAFHQVEHCVACASGTFAVELALRALKVGADDEVTQAAYDYSGNFLTIHAIQARPVLVDVRADNWNMNPCLLAEALGPATRAVIVSHLQGGIVPMREVVEICKARSIDIIEDAAQCPGAMVQGRPAGTWGDIGILSFGGSKLLTAGRGGAFLTQRSDLAQRGRTWQLRGNLLAPLSELQAAVLRPQLQALRENNAKRAANVERLLQALKRVPGLTAFKNEVEDSQPGYYKLGFQYDAGAFGLPRDRFVAAMRAEGIAIDPGFRALHIGRSPRRFRSAGDLTETVRAHEGAVVLHHPVLSGTPGDVAEVGQAVSKIYTNADRLRRADIATAPGSNETGTADVNVGES
jgi:dTDP-4-amino-4,6-dideoxygalactose transaminase